MRQRTRWRVQAHWTVGGAERSYAPVFVDTADAAEQVAQEMAATLAHVPGLEVRIDEVAGAPADAEEAAVAAARANARPPLLHVYDGADRSRARCGATLTATDALVSADLLALSTGTPCAVCLDLVR